MFYQPQFNNPYFNGNNNNQLTRVTGIEGAKTFQMFPNSTVALFDSNEDLMYIKSTDGGGFPTIRTFKFEEVTNTPKQDAPVDLSNYITREELVEILKDYGGTNNGKHTISEQPKSKQ